MAETNQKSPRFVSIMRYPHINRPNGSTGMAATKAPATLRPRNSKPTADYVLPPLPDEDDDLLHLYSSPVHIYDPLPLDLFPRPDMALERENAVTFPCSKYFDLSKYSLDDARKLSAMDLIPKESLKVVAEHTQRTKRLKRATTDSAQVAGYYRFKNEGVEVIYPTRDGSRGGGRGRRGLVQPDFEGEPAVDLLNSTRVEPEVVDSSSPPPPVVPTAQKQGNRKLFLANLRRNLLKPEKPMQAAPAPSSSRRKAAHPNFVPRRPVVKNGSPEPENEDSNDSSDESEKNGSSNSDGPSIVSNPLVLEKAEDGEKLEPVWMDEIEEGIFNQQQVIADEELGESDDDDESGGPYIFNVFHGSY